MTNKEQQGERLAFVIIALDLSQIKFCQHSGIQQSHLSNAIKGKKGISFTMLEKIATHYPRVNINYIFTGVGPVLLEEYQVSELREPSAPYGTKTRCEHLDALRQRLSQSLAIVEHIIAENCHK